MNKLFTSLRVAKWTAFLWVMTLVAGSSPASAEPTTEVTFVVFDTETTGLSPKKDRMVELGVVRMKDGQVVEEKSWLIHPERDIPYFAQKVHGITDAMVADAPRFKAIYPEFLSFIGDDTLVAHNAPFDIRFIEAEVRRAGLELPGNEVLDSLPLFRKWYPDSESHSLSAVAKHVKLPEDPNHRALMDAVVVGQILARGFEEFAPGSGLQGLYQDAGGPLYFH